MSVEMPVVPYEQRLRENCTWALEEAGWFFDQRGCLHDTLRRLAHELERLGVAYAVAGSMAMFRHGFRQFEDDVDILVNRQGLETLRRELPAHEFAWEPGPKPRLRDRTNGVRVDLIVAGERPVEAVDLVYPDPAEAAVEIGGIRCVPLPTLIECKLVAEQAPLRRLTHVGDIVDLMKVLRLREEYAERLHPSVRARFREFVRAVATEPEEP